MYVEIENLLGNKLFFLKNYIYKLIVFDLFYLQFYMQQWSGLEICDLGRCNKQIIVCIIFVLCKFRL